MGIRELWRGRNTVSMSPPPIPTAPNADLMKSIPTSEMKAYLESPIKLLDSMGYKDKPTALTYETLRLMSTKNSVVAAILLTRINQVSTFTKPARYNKDNIGYEIRLRDPNKIPTKEQKEVINALELFLERTGYDNDPDRDDFDQFIRKIVRDSLVYDQATFEVIPDRMGRPAQFVAVDAATIRAASESFVPDDHIKKDEEAKYVQVIDGQIQTWFTSRELAFGIRNPRTDIRLQPYGFSELEQLIHQITSHLYAEEYNSRFFSQGGTTKGIINLKQEPSGAANQEQLEAFKRQWRSQVSGMTGAWKTPVLQVPEGIEYINVSQSNREMEFEKWMNYLINIACAVYQIDPSEVNFPNNGGVGGTGGGVFDSSQESKLKNSRDKGLRPLLRFVESIINKNIISRFSNDYVFNFTGMDIKSEKEIMDLDTQSVRVYKTINEVRKEHDMAPLENGDVILDASFIGMITQQQQQQQMPYDQMGGGQMYNFPQDDSDNPENTDTSDNPENTDNSDNPNQQGKEPNMKITDEDLQKYSWDIEDTTTKSLSKMIIEIN